MISWSIYDRLVKNLFGLNREVGDYLCCKYNKAANYIMHQFEFITHATMGDKNQSLLENILAKNIDQQIFIDSSRQDHVAVLEYIRYIETQNLSEEKDNSSHDYSRITNTLIRADCILSIPGMPSEKINQLMQLASAPLKFDVSVQISYVRYVGYQFTKKFFYSIKNTDISPQSMELMNKLSDADYFMLGADKNATDVSKLHMYLVTMQNMIHIFKYHYGINNILNRFNKDAANIAYQYLCFANQHREKLYGAEGLEFDERCIMFLLMNGFIQFLNDNEQKKACENLIKMTHMREADFKKRVDDYAMALFMQLCDNALKYFLVLGYLPTEKTIKQWR